MNLVFTIVSAFAIGFFVRRRAHAVLTYLVLDALLFTFQTLGVLLAWLANDPPVAFGPSPQGTLPLAYDSNEYVGYGVVNAVIVAVGVGLVVLGSHVARRRAARPEAVPVG